MSGQMSAKEEEFCNTYSYGYDSSSSYSSANSGYSGSINSYVSGNSMDDVSLMSTESTYGSYGSWNGGDTHASGYEADCESNCSSTK